MKTRTVLCALCLTLGAGATTAETYRNPVLWCDVPDVGLCSDGKSFYMVSTTMHLAPGVPIMKSDDMIHWKTVSYVMPRLPDDEPRYNLGWDEAKGEATRRTAYGAGQWASSLRYHDGRFWVWFVMNGTGGFLYTADRAEGPWTLYARPPYKHDGSLFFDDDGKVYICHGDGWVTEMNKDITDNEPGGLDKHAIVRDEEETALLEGSSMFKHNGYYYWMMVSAYLPNHPRREVCYRSRDIAGPYEKKVVLETEFDQFGGVGQGCVVNRGDEWWALVFQDRGGVGRVPCLMPVNWVDDWPMLGEAANGGRKDLQPSSYRIPSDPSRRWPDLTGLIGSDEFDKPDLSLYWQINHNPVDAAWSLAERPGWLRLTTARKVDSLFLAPNTFTQRMCGPACEGTVRLDYAGLKDGDAAGLAAFQADSATLGVERAAGRTFLVMREERAKFDETDGRHAIKTVERDERERLELKGEDTVVYLRVKAIFDFGTDWCQMCWSRDGKAWRDIGPKAPLRFDHTRFFMGTKFGLYCYATKETGGHADFDWFRFRALGHEPPRRADTQR